MNSSVRLAAVLVINLTATMVVAQAPPDRDVPADPPKTASVGTAKLVANAAPVFAADVSSGQFGSSTGGGNYSFPARLGIGTTSPIDLLHVFTSAPNKQIFIQSSAANDVFGFRMQGTGTGGRDWRMEQGRSTPGQFNITDCSAGCAPRLVIQADGNIGIGATVPAERLHVLGNARIDGVLRVRNGNAVGNLNIIDNGNGYATIDNTGNSYLTISSAVATNFSNNVGIGTVPSFAVGSGLHISGSPSVLRMTNVAGLSYELRSEASGLANAGFSIFDATNNASRLTIDAFGNTAIGTTNIGARLHVASDLTVAPAGTPVIGASLNQFVVSGRTNVNKRVAIGFDTTYDYGIIGAMEAGVAWKDLYLQPNSSGVPSMVLKASGKVGIGKQDPTEALEVAGNVKVSLGITADTITANTITGTKVLGAVYQDIAEWVPASGDLEPGSVVVVSAGRTNEVTLSRTPYDTAVAGVISAQPGIVLGEASSAKELVATYGRVKVRVDASLAPISAGDLLVSSRTPGMAMKSVPLDVGGVPMHRPGTIIGKALEPLAGGTGEILVLLTLQ